MGDTLDLLGKQHQEVLMRLQEEEIRLSTGDANGALTAFTAYLESDVARHFHIEEQALFPVLARHPSLVRGPLTVMDAEHSTFRERLHRLRAAVDLADVDKQERYARDLIDLLREHIAKEDGVLFPMAARMLTDDEQREVDAYAAAM